MNLNIEWVLFAEETLNFPIISIGNDASYISILFGEILENRALLIFSKEQLWVKTVKSLFIEFPLLIRLLKIFQTNKIERFLTNSEVFDLTDLKIQYFNLNYFLNVAFIRSIPFDFLTNNFCIMPIYRFRLIPVYHGPWHTQQDKTLNLNNKKESIFIKCTMAYICWINWQKLQWDHKSIFEHGIFINNSCNFLFSL